MTKEQDEDIFLQRRAKTAALLLTGKFPKDFGFDMSVYGGRLLVRDAEGEPVRDPQTGQPQICGTAGCIAGLVVFANDLGNIRAMNWSEIHQKAAWYLGLDLVPAEELFTPGDTALPEGYDDITELEAGRVLAHFVKTDKIDWSKRKDFVRVGKRKF